MRDETIQNQPTEPAELEGTVDEAPEGPAIGIHVVMMTDGQFGIQATGEPNLGEMAMLLSRALDSVRARMVGETVAQVMAQAKQGPQIVRPTAGERAQITPLR